MANVVSSINVVSQIGQEVTIGAGGTAGKQLRSLIIEPADELTIREIMAQGHRFDTDTVIDKAWTSWQASMAALDYAEQLYLLENIFGAGTLTSPGTATKKRVYTPPATGNITPKTNVFQWGDANDNVNIMDYVLCTDYGETWDRESGVKLNGAKGIAQLVTTGGAFTAAPTQMAQVPIAASDFNIYLDTSWAQLGTTQITDEIETVDWSLTGMKAERWSANRSNKSFAGHVDTRPKGSVKFTIYEGTVARPIIASLEAGGVYFLRIDGQSKVFIDNYFTVGVGAATGGTFTLTYKTQTTAGIAYNALASDVQTALTALSSIGAGNVTVTGTAPNWTITMAGTLANDPAVMTGSGTSLTGGTFTIAGTQLPYMAQRDLCVRLAKVAALKDVKGVYGRELDFYIVEDATTGNALTLTSQTAEASL